MLTLSALSLLLSAAPLASASGGSFTIHVSEVKGPLDGETDELFCFNADPDANSGELRETTENLRCVLSATRWMDFEAALEVKPEKRKKEPTCSVSSSMNDVRFKRDAKTRVPTWTALFFDSGSDLKECHVVTSVTLEYRPAHPIWTLRFDSEVSTTPGSAKACPASLVAKTSRALTSEESFPHFSATFGPCKVLLGMSGGTLKSDLMRAQKEKR